MPETPLARIEADDETIIGWFRKYAAEHGLDDGLCPSDDPEHDSEDCACAEDFHFEQFGGYPGMDTLAEVRDVATAIRETGGHRLTVSPIHDGDGAVDAFMVEAYMDESVYLSKFVEWKHITDDREATGLFAALGIAHALIGEFNHLADYAIKKGLAPHPLTDATVKVYDHDARPADDNQPGDRCKDCGDDVTWVGPSSGDWLHVDDPDNREHDDKRADGLGVGDVYQEYGGFAWYRIVTLTHHGDRVLIVTHDGIETSLDGDDVVRVVLTPTPTP